LPLDKRLARYTQYDPAVPVWCIAPGRGDARRCLACPPRVVCLRPASASRAFALLTAAISNAGVRR